MSGEYAKTLQKRALNAIRWAKRACEEGDYDTCALQAEHAVQLYLKSIIYRITGEEARGHDIRELFGILTAALLEQEGKELAEEMSDYLRKHRRELAELTGAQTRAAYGLVEYGEREARMLLRIAEEAIEKLKELEGKIFA